MNADISPQDAIERVRERGDIIKWEDRGHTFVIRRPDDADEILSRFAVERHHNGEIIPQPRLDPLSLLNVLESRNYTVVSKGEDRV